MRPRLTISMPCYRRPLRTAIAIECIRQQTMVDFEAFVLGDGCPVFLPVQCDRRFYSFNSDINHGACGYFQTNFAINAAVGKYFIFMGNDDFIAPSHFENYLSAIEGTDLDFVWFKRVLNQGRERWFKMKSYSIGHCALIIRTDFLKKMPKHQGQYNHDWHLIYAMVQAGARYKCSWKAPTYHIDPYRWRGTNNDV
jgi:glycosyltransferase involved in cell wall biosynthesis